VELVPPPAADAVVKAAARRRQQRFFLLRRTVAKTIYLTAAAACVMLVAGVFFFSDRDPQNMFRRASSVPPMAAWRSGFDRNMFEVDTEIEINRELINLGPDRSRQETLDVLLPLPASGAVDPDPGDDNGLII